MPERTLVALTPVPVTLSSPEFGAILDWPFSDAYVSRLLRHDIPRRVKFGNCQIWAYRNPENRIAGFGTIDVCDDWREFAGGQLHPYIPLLAVNPTIQSQGYGTSIVRHLIAEAALRKMSSGCHDVLYLDVYSTNDRAIALYTRCGFQEVARRTDPLEGGKEYVLMAQRVSFA
jgi:ribosomal protein S18 acetylase RimI-like enzyme